MVTFAPKPKQFLKFKKRSGGRSPVSRRRENERIDRVNRSIDRYNDAVNRGDLAEAKRIYDSDIRSGSSQLSASAKDKLQATDAQLRQRLDEAQAERLRQSREQKEKAQQVQASRQRERENRQVQEFEERDGELQERERRREVDVGGEQQQVEVIDQPSRAIFTPRYGIGFTNLKTKSTFTKANEIVSETKPFQFVQQVAQGQLATSIDEKQKAGVASQIAVSNVPFLTPTQRLVAEIGAQRTIEGFSATRATGAGALQFVGEKPLTATALVATGFVGKVAGTALLARGGATAFATKTALTASGGIAVGSEAISIAQQPTTTTRYARLGESIAKFGLVGLGSKLADPIVSPLSKAELQKAQDLQRQVGKEKGFFREDTQQLGLRSKKTDGPITVTQKSLGKLINTKEGFVARGETTTTISKYGIPRQFAKEPFTSQLNTLGRPSIGSPLSIRAPSTVTTAIGKTFTADIRPSNKAIAVTTTRGRVTKFARAQIQGRAFVPPSSKFLLTTPQAKGTIFTFRKGDPTKFFLLNKRGQLALSPPKTTTITTGNGAKALASLSVGTPQAFTKISTPKFPVLTAPLTRTAQLTSTRQKSGQLQVQGPRSLSATSTRSLSALSSRQSTAQLQQSSQSFATIAPQQTLQQLQPVPPILATPNIPIIPQPTGFGFLDFEFETPRRKKKKKGKAQKVTGARVFAQDLTAKALNLRPIDVKLEDLGKISTTPIGIRRGVRIR